MKNYLSNRYAQRVSAVKAWLDAKSETGTQIMGEDGPVTRREVVLVNIIMVFMFTGILAADNSEAKFVAVDEAKGGFHATRCFVKLDSGNNTTLTTYHLAAGATTSISAIAAANGKVDVYSVSGVKVASGINAEQVQRLQPGVYVVNGQKVLVK